MGSFKMWLKLHHQSMLSEFDKFQRGWSRRKFGLIFIFCAVFMGILPAVLLRLAGLGVGEILQALIGAFVMFAYAALGQMDEIESVGVVADLFIIYICLVAIIGMVCYPMLYRWRDSYMERLYPKLYELYCKYRG